MIIILILVDSFTEVSVRCKVLCRGKISEFLDKLLYYIVYKRKIELLVQV